MKGLPRCAVLVACVAFRLGAQQPPAAGVDNAWDARKLVAAAVKSNEDLRPILTALHPQEWVDKKGAPSTYIVQWQSAQEQLRYAQIEGAAVAQHIESLPALLALYYRMEALETTTRSVAQGAEQYAPRPDADKLDRWVGQGFEARRRLREYMQDLAVSLEQNFKIADEEAQRCRGTITKTPPPSSGKAARK